jgi:hypothetical protein
MKISSILGSLALLSVAAALPSEAGKLSESCNRHTCPQADVPKGARSAALKRAAEPETDLYHRTSPIKRAAEPETDLYHRTSPI